MSIKESALNTITALTNSDFVRMVTSAGASRKATLQNIAQHIIESYAGSTLAGSQQSVKSALDELNSTLTPTNVTAAVTLNENLTIASSAWFSVVKYGKLVGVLGTLRTSADVPVGNIMTGLPTVRNTNGIVTYIQYSNDHWGGDTPTLVKVAMNPGTGNMQIRSAIPADKSVFFHIWYVTP